MVVVSLGGCERCRGNCAVPEGRLVFIPPLSGSQKALEEAAGDGGFTEDIAASVLRLMMVFAQQGLSV